MNELLTEATKLAQQLESDISQAATRVDHIRMTARANEAWNLVRILEKLSTNEVV
jgi:hypothetical protein